MVFFNGQLIKTKFREISLIKNHTDNFDQFSIKNAIGIGIFKIVISLVQIQKISPSHVFFSHQENQNQQILEDQQNAQGSLNPNKNISLLFIVFFHFNPQEEKVQGQQLNKPSKKLLSEQYASIF